jgi:hypothetical protein
MGNRPGRHALRAGETMVARHPDAVIHQAGTRARHDVSGELTIASDVPVAADSAARRKVK